MPCNLRMVVEYLKLLHDEEDLSRPMVQNIEEVL
jgi:hypothetical protein